MIYVTRGLPGSGKSTWAKQWVAEDRDNRARVNRDDIRITLFGQTRGVDEELVSRVEEHMVQEAVKAGKDVVIDAMHLKAAYVKRWTKYDTVETRDFPVPVDECVHRDYNRAIRGGNHVGEDVIRGLAKRFHIPAGGTLPKVDLSGLDPIVHRPYIPGKIPAYSFDIDGTLALMGDRRGPYDTSKYHLDEPCPSVSALYHSLYVDRWEATPELRFIGLSGRSEDFRTETEAWLNKHHIDLDELFMRPSGDTRNDAIVKSEMVDEFVSNKYNVIAHFDDRARVVQALRAKGMKVYQVSEGDF